MRTVFALLLMSCLMFAQKGAAPWSLTFSDDFNGAELDLSKWVPHAPAGQVSVPGAVDVRGGQLHIGGGTATTFGIFSQTYGRFEIRCKVSASPGLRARFRLVPVSLGLPAIDVFEVDTSAPSKVFFANHWGTEQTERSFGDSFTMPDLTAALHVIAVEWDSDRIAWFIDGKKRFESVEGVPRQPMFLAGDGAFDIDYIRVYQRR